MAVPTLLYGCETWALNRSDERKIETPVAKCGTSSRKKSTKSDTPNTSDMVNVLKEPVCYSGYTSNANNHHEI
jgi:hypothetical protein